MLRAWIGTWTQAAVPPKTARIWTVATIAPLDCGPKKPEPGQRVSQPCPRKLRSIALGQVLMRLTKSCVIEQHIDKLLKVVEPTNLGLGTADAALIVRIVRGWACDMAAAPKGGQDGDVIRSIDLQSAFGRALRSTCLEAARLACPHLAAVCAAQWEPRDTKFWHRCDDGWTVDSTSRGGWHCSRAMQVMFVLGLEHAVTELDSTILEGLRRIGLQDDMTFIGSAAAINRSWNDLECTLAEAGHRLRGYKCGTCARRLTRKRLGISLLGSAANVQHGMHVGLGQPAEVWRGWKRPLIRCRALNDSCVTSTTMSALRRRGCC